MGGFTINIEDNSIYWPLSYSLILSYSIYFNWITSRRTVSVGQLELPSQEGNCLYKIICNHEIIYATYSHSILPISSPSLSVSPSSLSPRFSWLLLPLPSSRCSLSATACCHSRREAGSSFWDWAWWSTFDWKRLFLELGARMASACFRFASAQGKGPCFWDSLRRFWFIFALTGKIQRVSWASSAN